MARLITILGDPTVQRNILLVLVALLGISAIFNNAGFNDRSSASVTRYDDIATPTLPVNPISNAGLRAQTGEDYEYLDIYKPGGASKITKVSMLYGDLANDIRYKAALHSQRQHAERHGHGLKVRSIGFKSEFWSKYSFLLKIMLEELEKPKHWRTQWLCWVGYDVVLTNAYVPLDIFLPPGKNFSHVNALVTRDWTGLSSDVFFLRVNEWSTRYLSSVMSFYENQPDLQLQNGSDRRAQQYVSSHIHYRNKTMLLPARWFNSVEASPELQAAAPAKSANEPETVVPQLRKRYVNPDSFNRAPGPKSQYRDHVFQPGDLMLKMSEKKKKKEVLELVKLAKKPGAGYLVSLDRLTIRQEIKRFWESHQEVRDRKTKAHSHGHT